MNDGIESNSLKINYSEIFQAYLDMNKFFRMDLFNTLALHEWIKRLDIDSFFNEYSNFFIFLEYLYKQNYVIPFFVIKFSKSNKKLDSINPNEIIISYISFNSWNNLKKNKFLQFIDQDVVSEFQYKKKKYNRIKDSFENDYCYYYYHPIQFMQILTFIYSLYKNKINLISIKEFNDYYKKRWSELEFDVVLQSRALGIALKKGLTTKEDIISRIESECSKIEELPFKRYNWLTSKFFNFWIKLESIFLPSYYSPFLKPSYSIYDVNISKREWNKTYNKEEKFRLKLYKERLDYFDSEEKRTIRGFIWSMRNFYHNFNGLDHWSDLILETGRNKKDKLKGIMSYFVNILQIVRTLEIADWDLKTNNEKKESTKPIFIYTKEEHSKYRQKLLIDYELVAEKNFI